MPKHANDRALDTVSLRDYFAAAALQGLVSGVDDPDTATVATMAYELADAMLVERVSDDDAE